jgi:hypothetical protein
MTHLRKSILANIHPHQGQKRGKIDNQGKELPKNLSANKSKSDGMNLYDDGSTKITEQQCAKDLKRYM